MENATMNQTEVNNSNVAVNETTNGFDELLGVQMDSAEVQNNPFVKNLTGSPTAARKQRATALMIRVRESQENLIRAIRSKINQLQNDLRVTCDLRGTNTMDLQIRNINPIEFVNKIQSIKMDIYAEKIALSNAQETYRQLFGADYK